MFWFSRRRSAGNGLDHKAARIPGRSRSTAPPGLPVSATSPVQCAPRISPPRSTRGRSRRRATSTRRRGAYGRGAALHAGGAGRQREGGTGRGAALGTWRVGARVESPRSGRLARGAGADARAGARPDPLRADARLAVHLLPRRGLHHGRRPRDDAADGPPRAALRRRALSNFGVFAAPDRRLVFDINDFDETLPGPLEWDVKRLAASFEVAGRDRGFDEATRRSVDRRRPCARTARRWRASRRCGTSTSGTRASTSTEIVAALLGRGDATSR